MPKNQKLKYRAAFRKTSSLKLITQNSYFKLLGKLSYQATFVCPKVGLVISRKKLKQATKRNRVKRRLEEAYRVSIPSLQPELGRFEYLIFFLEADLLNAPFEKLLQALKPIKTRFKS